MVDESFIIHCQKPITRKTNSLLIPLYIVDDAFNQYVCVNNMNKFVDNKTVITSFLVLALIYFPFSSTVDLHAQQRGNITVIQATALPLVNAEGIDSYQQGSADGRAAGIADYPNNDNDCPSGHSTAYCAGWSGGYRTGFNAQRTLDESGRHSGNDDNDDDDEN